MAETATAQQNETLTGEFVTGGGSAFSTAEILYGGNFDYLQPNFSSEAARRMRFDSEVESSVEYLTNAVFSEGIMPVSAITDEEDKNFDLAQEIAGFVKYATGDAVRSLEAVSWELFFNTYFNGFKAAEIVLRLDGNLDLVLDRLNVKSNDSIAFAVDRFKNVIGIAGLTDKGFPSVLNDANTIRRDKFLIFQFELEDNDPRGVKKIQSAVDAWCDKKDTKVQWKHWRKTSAIPKKVGIAPPNARDIPVRDGNGQQIIDNGIPRTITVEKALSNALDSFGNDSNITAPHGTVIEQLEVSGTGQQFTNALKFNNSEIRKSVLGDSLATGEADKDARAARESAMGVVDLRVMLFRMTVARAIKYDVYRLLTVLKFGETNAHLTPNCALGGTENRTWEATASALQKIGYRIAPEHMREGDQMLGFTPRDKDAVTEIEPDEVTDTENQEEENTDE